MDPIELTKKLVSIPSYLSEKTNEQKVGDFIYDYLKQFDFLTVEKQPVEDDRFNVIARTKGEPKLLLAGHMDTVEPKQGGKYDPLKPTIDGDRLYGLGACDTKSTVAAMLSAVQDVQGLTFLFYCDEEYDFKGMKKYLAEQKTAPAQLAIFAEPTDMKIENQYAGLIEISFSVRGQTGHAARPQDGKNAITELMASLDRLKTWLDKSSLNIAYVRGGLDLGDGKIGQEGNNIPDYAQAVIDIRPISQDLRAQTIIDWLKKDGLDLIDYKIRHDYGSLYTDPQDLKALTDLEYLQPNGRGYSDGQLLQEKFNIPVINLGVSGNNSHAADEWVDIKSIEKLSKIYQKICS